MNREWKNLSREERAALVLKQQSEGLSQRKISEHLGTSKGAVYEHSVYGRISPDLRSEYHFLSLKSFVKAAKSKDIQSELLQEKIKQEFSKQRRRMLVLVSQLRVIERDIMDEYDKWKLGGLSSRRDRVIEKLKNCPPCAGSIETDGISGVED